VAKFRAARRLWARLMRERVGAENPRSWQLRFHTQTGGSTLTAQQPENNVVRVALQALAAVCGGTQSLHTNSLDEALALPSESAATLALRTQQVIAHETGAADTVDPFAGSYFVEALTGEIEQAAMAYLERIDEFGGALGAIEAGYPQEEISRSAYAYQMAVEREEQVIVGVNRFTDAEEQGPAPFPIDPAIEVRQVERVRAFRRARDGQAAARALQTLESAARAEDNLMPLIIDAVRKRATLGEICDRLRGVFGEYQRPERF
jgi:methylmalonyl-CoA mutase N-terminal domain/subunit